MTFGPPLVKGARMIDNPLAVFQDGSVFVTLATGRSDEVNATVNGRLIVCLLERDVCQDNRSLPLVIGPANIVDAR